MTPEILHVTPTRGGLYILWRLPEGNLRAIGAPSWGEAIRIMEGAIKGEAPEVEIDGDAWADAIFAALRSILRQGQGK